MAGIKRKSGAPTNSDGKAHSKKAKVEKSATKSPRERDAVKPVKAAKKSKAKAESEDLVESDTSEDDSGFYGFSADADGPDDEQSERDDRKAEAQTHGKVKRDSGSEEGNKASSNGPNGTSSREAHAKQKALAKERKAAKPHADILQRSKKLWEKLRLKSHIEKDERKELVKELFEIVTGRVKELVFKHDAGRVIQCAIKYSTIEQRRMIARELQGEYKILAEGKYSKFLIAKLLEKGDPEIRDMIISEFYSHVRRMINHPEAAWILDDTYRQVATPDQKKRLLREWYGPEFSIKGLKVDGPDTADLSTILSESPEKRKPIMDYLEGQINQLIQKKLTAFTMLHDAMLQYFLALKPGSSEANEFLEHLKPDATLKEGEEADNVDLLKNLAFTKPGSRLMSLAFAYGTAKDRKLFIRPYKDSVELMAYDPNAHHVLLAALAVTDDTKLTSKSIFGELLPANDTLAEKVLNLTSDPNARTVLLYPLAADAKWLLNDNARERLSEVYEIRSQTSKKEASTRLHELARAIESQLLTAITARAADFAAFGFGLQFLGEVLVGVPEIESGKRKEALTVIAQLAQQILECSLPASGDDKPTSQGKNMLKTLVQGGKFDPESKKVVPVEPPLGFADLFWDQIKDNAIQWATGQGSFVIVGLVEADGFTKKAEALRALKKGRKELQAAVNSVDGDEKPKKGQKGKKNAGKSAGNAGAKILLEKL